MSCALAENDQRRTMVPRRALRDRTTLPRDRWHFIEVPVSLIALEQLAGVPLSRMVAGCPRVEASCKKKRRHRRFGRYGGVKRGRNHPCFVRRTSLTDPGPARPSRRLSAWRPCRNGVGRCSGMACVAVSSRRDSKDTRLTSIHAKTNMATTTRAAPRITMSSRWLTTWNLAERKSGAIGLAVATAR
jgi:hypothetical protein